MGASHTPTFIHVVFDGPPGPESGRFVETEMPDGSGTGRFGQWVDRGDGQWSLAMWVCEPPPLTVGQPVEAQIPGSWCHRLRGVVKQLDAVEHDGTVGVLVQFDRNVCVLDARELIAL